MAKITLYNFPQSTCSQKVRLTMWEKGIPYEDYIVDHAKREHLGDAYLSLNPNGVVPTITHGESVIIDSSVIMEYLEEVFPETPMSPKDPVGRAHMRKWLRYLEEVPTPAIRVPSFNTFLSKRYANMADDTYQEMADRHPVRKHFYKRMNKVGFSAEETAESIDRLDQAAQRFNDALAAHGKPWIMGGRHHHRRRGVPAHGRPHDRPRSRRHGRRKARTRRLVPALCRARVLPQDLLQGRPADRYFRARRLTAGTKYNRRSTDS